MHRNRPKRFLSGCLAVFLVAVLSSIANAQPVATEDDAARVFTGYRSSPVKDSKTGEIQFEQRLLLSMTYRIVPDFDLGLGLPSPRFAPDVGLANPYITSLWHIVHDPVWLSLRTFVEPPLLNDRPLNVDQSLDSNIRSVPFVEIFSGLRTVFIVTEPNDSLFWANTGFIWKVFDTFGIGPEGNVRFNTNGFDTWAVGSRFRLEVRHNQKPLAVWFVTATITEGRFDTTQMNLLTFITWYWRS
jgi:hypothetical protein